jgi:CPA2 family monovalent cation:H+ antiporter-2
LIHLSVSLALALVLGLITQRLRLSPIVGYLLAGTLLGPKTPGFVVDPQMAQDFAEIGVVLLMFGVGLHFNLGELLAVNRIAIPGAVAQITVATLLGLAVTLASGWADETTTLIQEVGSGLILGIAISVASTVVLIRVLMDNDVLHTAQGHIAVGWLIVEDIFTVLVLVVLSAVAVPPDKQTADAKRPPAQPVQVLSPALQDALKLTPEQRKQLADVRQGVEGELGQVLTDEQKQQLEQMRFSAPDAAKKENLWAALAWAAVNMTFFAGLMVVAAKWIIPWLMRQVAMTRSRELFTLAVLALALAIATGSAELFGVSMALGAFLAGMVVGQTEVSHQAAADALPMRDAFAVLFFVSVGMLFDYSAVLHQPWLLLALLAVVLIAKPLTALVIVWAFRYSVRTALTVAIALAQIGEFSFLLAQEAERHGVLSAERQSLLVICALISITANPLLFSAIDPIERWLRARPRLWRAISQRAEAGGVESNRLMGLRLAVRAQDEKEKLKAVVVGYGPVGQTATRILREFNIQPVIVDLNLDTVRGLADAGELAVYGDATRREILTSAGIRDAKYLLVTTPEVLVRTLVIIAAKDLNPDLHVITRARYVHERAWLEEVGATEVCTEEAETAVGLATVLLREVGADKKRVRQEIERIERELGSHRRESDAERTEKETLADVLSTPGKAPE